MTNERPLIGAGAAPWFRAPLLAAGDRFTAPMERTNALPLVPPKSPLCVQTKRESCR